jgi:hypothetical protein
MRFKRGWLLALVMTALAVFAAAPAAPASLIAPHVVNWDGPVPPPHW